MERIATLAREFVSTFVPLFIAIDAVGVLPLFLGLTNNVVARERTRMVGQAMLTALIIGLVFVAVGKGIFLLLGVTVPDFLVAGGLLLLVISIADLAMSERREEGLRWQGPVGIVPIGTPLVLGPAALTTLLLLTDQYRVPVVLLAFIINLAFAWLVFSQANRIANRLGTGTLKGVAKVASLLLAAIAIRMIRQGIMEIVGI